MLSLSLKLLDAAAMEIAPSGRNGKGCFSVEYVFEDISKPRHTDISSQKPSFVAPGGASTKPLPRIPPKLPPPPPKPMLPPKPPKSLSCVSCTQNKLLYIEQTQEKYTAKRALIRI